MDCESKCSFDTIVISGGSVKGSALLGALYYVFSKCDISNIKNFVGTSVGTIIIFLLSIGYTPLELMIYLCTHGHEFTSKMSNVDVLKMVAGNGATSFAPVQEELEKLTIEKIGKLPTLRDIETKFGKKLVLCTFNVTKHETEYLSADNHPDLPCITAIRMSCNIPLIFEKFMYNNNLYVDGGISDNFPIKKAEELGTNILGICLLTDHENLKVNDLDIIDYLTYLASTLLNQIVHTKLDNCNKNNVVVNLKCPLIKPMQFEMGTAFHLQMFSNGYQTFKEYFEKRTF
jgi:predicted acylesterase/phospholipase RssA